MSKAPDSWKLGIHAQPDAIVASPDYARRLIGDAGVDHFVVRSGYGFDYPDSLEKAIQIVRDGGAQVCIMVGVFWGRERKIPDNPPYKSHESEFPASLPGSPDDEKWVAKLQKLCGQFKPDAITLTHARFRHPAILENVFNEGSEDQAFVARMAAVGVTRPDVIAARAAAERALGSAETSWLLKTSEGGLIAFLGALTQSDVWERYFNFRCQAVTSSIKAFRQAVLGFEGISFGSNAYSPTAAKVCGQDYDVLAGLCDFVQPLLGYMEWHRYEPLAAWGKYLLKHNTKLDERTAIETAKNLFYQGGTICPDTIAGLSALGENTDQSVLSMLGREIGLCAGYRSKPYRVFPILRGKEWSIPVIHSLMAEAKRQCGGVVFMGCEALPAGTPPSADGWK